MLVTGNLVASDHRVGRSRWLLRMADASDPSRRFVSMEVTLSWPGAGALPNDLSLGGTQSWSPDKVAKGLLEDLPAEFNDARFEMDFKVWPDELEDGKLSLGVATNYFVGLASQALGRAPDGMLELLKLQKEGLAFVVRRFVGCFGLCRKDPNQARRHVGRSENPVSLLTVGSRFHLSLSLCWVAFIPSPACDLVLAQ